MDKFSEQPDGHGPPWGWQSSLQQMAQDAGVDFEQFMQLTERQVADDQMAAMLKVSPETVRSLKLHFEAFGLDSVQGQD